MNVGCWVLIASVVLGTILRGYVLSQFWSWFVVPLGVVAISVPWALGISTMVWFLTDHAKRETYEGKATGEAIFHASFMAVAGPVLAWGLGFTWAWMGGLL